MPNNLQAEQNLLGAILLDNSVLERIDDRLLADHFYDPSHGRIFSTMQRLVERGQLANPVTLKSFFTDSDDFQRWRRILFIRTCRWRYQHHASTRLRQNHS